MTIKNITTNDLRKMNNKEGLILQGCGGEVKEWVDGINDILTENGILLDDTKFDNVSVFQNEGVTCILYPFDNVQCFAITARARNTTAHFFCLICHTVLL